MSQPTHCKSLCSATEEWTICSLLEGCVQQAASHGHQLPRHTSGTLPSVVAAQSTAVLTGGQVVTPPALHAAKEMGARCTSSHCYSVLLPLQANGQPVQGSWAKLRIEWFSYVLHCPVGLFRFPGDVWA